MAEAKRVDFNALPREVRERLISCMQHQSYPYPLLSSIPSQGAAIAGWFVLALLGFILVVGTLLHKFGEELQSMPVMFLYFLGTAIVLLSILFLIRRVRLGSALPYKPGRFLFPMDFINAEDRVLRIVPMSALVDFRGVHQHTNGIYNGTTLTFTFEGGITETFTIHGKERAEEVLRQLGASQRAIREAAEARDIEALMKIDPLFEVRVKDTWAVQAPRDEDMQQPAAKSLGALLAKGTILGVAAGAAALVALPMWHTRNVASDEAMFTHAKEVDREWLWEQYVREGKRHLDEARDELLPRAALREAKEKGSVTALRDFLKKYPTSVVEKEARNEIHALFTKTLGEFREQASTDDPKLQPFMEKLLGYLEKNDTARVEARFEAPSTEKLGKVDQLLREKGAEIEGGNIVPVAPHFGEKVSVQREAEIVRSLQQGFEKVFPADVMALKQGPRIGPDGKPLAEQPKDDRDPYDRLREAAGSKNPAEMRAALAAIDARDGKITKDPDVNDVQAPTIEVRYEVSWAGDFFTEEKGDRKFVGIVVFFHVAMKIPGETDKLEFDLPVQPPDHFTVDYTNPMYGIGGGPSEGRVYDVMAARAFDQLSDRMRRVFFKVGSKAYGPLDPDDVQEEAPTPEGVFGLPNGKAPPPGKRTGTKL
ncbi:hypothetical protein [Polyangium sp. 6x1]|uniref:hypothetical protein n=1 Tax=Polyangium sp. 6x1 TaxID=3042689 RepID=UPI00248270C7|nr:hypothetical protein [Polyangium sp. 6x1]MDI1448471.1 hypothetical protein [Polyangium sp. 6x1]